MDATWVDTDEALRRWCERLSDEPRIAVDTEANSMFVYHEQICLVQVSVPGTDLLIDPFVLDMSPLGRVLQDPSVQKVMHGADYDILIFKRRENVGIINLFDTMIAARVLGWPKCGLASLLEEHFGFRANKAFQRHDWAQRPLSEEALAYARCDTHYLLQLADIQIEALDAGPHRALFDRACERQTAVVPRERTFDPDGYWKVKGARELDEVGRSILKATYAWREGKAAALDRPPFRVLPELAMLSLARTRPRSRAELANVKGMPKPLARRDGPELLSVIEEAATQPCPEPLRPLADKVRTERVDTLKTWRKNEAARLGVDPEIVLDRASLMTVVDGDVSALEPWERERYGDAIAAALGSSA